MPNISDENVGCYTEHGVSGYGVAAKVTHTEPMTEEFVKSMAEQMMLAIANKCIELGAKCIGHIKSHLRTEAGTIKADTIGVGHGCYSFGRLEHPVRDVFIAINSIVQGIPEDAVKAATLEGMHDVADQYGLLVVKEKEHTYFDEFDFTASKQEYIKQLSEQLEAEKTG
ncbi:MAG: hypothetical protein WA151_11765 [Desulfatirhabdiaceae bacterium]